MSEMMDKKTESLTEEERLADVNGGAGARIPAWLHPEAAHPATIPVRSAANACCSDAILANVNGGQAGYASNTGYQMGFEDTYMYGVKKDPFNRPVTKQKVDTDDGISQKKLC